MLLLGGEQTGKGLLKELHMQHRTSSPRAGMGRGGLSKRTYKA